MGGVKGTYMPRPDLRFLPGLTLAILGVALLLLAAGAVRTGAATPPEPTYGSAVVDGSSAEWVAGDFFADMYRAGNPNFAVMSKLYVRYECSTNVLFVLVLSVR